MSKLIVGETLKSVFLSNFFTTFPIYPTIYITLVVFH